jgi:hypothetical protein
VRVLLNLNTQRATGTYEKYSNPMCVKQHTGKFWTSHEISGSHNDDMKMKLPARTLRRK